MALTEHYVTTGGTDTWANSTSSSTPCSLETARANAAAGDRVNILSGTYTLTAAFSLANAGSVGSPIVLRGCSSFSPLTAVPFARTNAHGALVTTDMPVLTCNSAVQITAGAYMVFENLVVSGAINGILINGNAATSTVFRNCSVTNSNSNASAVCIGGGGNGFEVVRCDGYLTGSTNANYVFAVGAQTTGQGLRIMDCRAVNLASSGAGCFSVTGSTALGFVGNQATASAGIGLLLGDTRGTIVGNTFHGQATAAIQTPNAAATNALMVVNNVFSSCGRALLNPYNATAAHPLLSVSNLYYANTSTNLGFGDWPEYGRVDGDPLFVDAANRDLRIGATSPAVNAALSGGDIGACQRAAGTIPAVGIVQSGQTYNVGGQEGTLTGTYAGGAGGGGARVIGSTIIRGLGMAA